MQSFPSNRSTHLAETIGQVRCWISGWKPIQIATLLFCCFVFCFSGCRVTQTWNDASIPTVSLTQSLPSIATESRQAIVIPFLSDSEKGALPRQTEQVEPLSLRDCESMAATNAPLAKVLEQESKNSPCVHKNVDPAVQSSINAAINANASYQRNITAEKALLVYLGLTEVYLQTQVSNESIVEIEKLQEILTQLQLEGLVREVDPELLVRKKLELQAKRSELNFNFDDLNQKLRLLLGLNDSANPIWTDCQIQGWTLPNDLDSEIALATKNRADITALKSFIQSGSDDLLDLMRSSIRSVSPLAASVIQRRFLGGIFKDNSAEIQKLRMQLAILNENQIALVKSEVTESYHAIRKYSELIELAQKKLDSLHKSESRLGARRQVGAIKIDEVLAVKSEILETRSELIHWAILLQMEWIKMKSRQGLLGAVDLEVNGNSQNEFQSGEYLSSKTPSQDLLLLPNSSPDSTGVLPQAFGRPMERKSSTSLPQGDEATRLSNKEMRLNPPHVTKASYQSQDRSKSKSLSEMLREKRFEMAPLR